MAKSWINPNDRTQEEWARKYLLKKRSGMTNSIEGSDASKAWQGNSALEFLRSLEARSWDEAAIILLKKMKAAWTQQVRKNRSSKTIQVHISLSHSKQLKQLADDTGFTKREVMEALITNNYKNLKESKASQTYSRDKTKKMLIQLQESYRVLQEEKKLLEDELDNEKRENESLRIKNLELIKID